MTNTTTATVETLTAEVRVLMVGSRQVTLSVYNQLDMPENILIDPGADDRVALKAGRESSKRSGFDIDNGNIVTVMVEN